MNRFQRILGHVGQDLLGYRTSHPITGGIAGIAILAPATLGCSRWRIRRSRGSGTSTLRWFCLPLRRFGRTGRRWLGRRMMKQLWAKKRQQQQCGGDRWHQITPFRKSAFGLDGLLWLGRRRGLLQPCRDRQPPSISAADFDAGNDWRCQKMAAASSPAKPVPLVPLRSTPADFASELRPALCPRTRYLKPATRLHHLRSPARCRCWAFPELGSTRPFHRVRRSRFLSDRRPLECLRV